jgi:hypothetical protein
VATSITLDSGLASRPASARALDEADNNRMLVSFTSTVV